METKKRVSLYFNLDDIDEKTMYEYLSQRKKSQYIKNLILNDIKGNNRIIQDIANVPAPNRIDDLADCCLDADGIDID